MARIDWTQLPAPPGMTTLRDFPRREAIAAVEWIAQLSDVSRSAS
jgi:hypothetical protein